MPLSSKDGVFRREELWLFLIMVAVDVFFLTYFGNPPSWWGLKYCYKGMTPKEQWQFVGISFLSITVQLVWVWVAGIQMRQKIRKQLGRKATYADLTSIDTWMKV